MSYHVHGLMTEGQSLGDERERVEYGTCALNPKPIMACQKGSKGFRDTTPNQDNFSVTVFNSGDTLCRTVGADRSLGCSVGLAVGGSEGRAAGFLVGRAIGWRVRRYVSVSASSGRSVWRVGGWVGRTVGGAVVRDGRGRGPRRVRLIYGCLPKASRYSMNWSCAAFRLPFGILRTFSC